MALTQFLVSRGQLSSMYSSPRFGSVPKVLFAGACGYFAGKLSYMKTCQEKFKRLENSRLGEALRQRSEERGRKENLVSPKWYLNRSASKRTMLHVVRPEVNNHNCQQTAVAPGGSASSSPASQEPS
uniref:OCIA domain-containing protein 1 n=1 Tax=Pygocentrus nattereri TaxID=42514 RepID=A0AAR2J9I7_PYGNA